VFPLRAGVAHAKCATPLAANFARGAEIPRTLALTAPTRRDRTGLASRNRFAVFAALGQFPFIREILGRDFEDKFFAMYSHTCGVERRAGIHFRDVRAERPRCCQGYS
jgi:hypothetical protein